VAFAGKGGVGKTTLSAAYALERSRRGDKVLVVSLDPAHNLGDVFERKLSEEPTPIETNLYAIEVDYDAMLRRSLKKLSEKIKDMYGYLRVFNLDKYIDVLQHSPGIEEHAVLETMLDVIRRNEAEWGFNIVVFDTPPTGLTLRIMALPSLSLLWVEKLMELRLAILARRRAVERVLGTKPRVSLGGREVSLATEPRGDPVYAELLKIREEYSFVDRLLKDPQRFSVVMVVNPEALPVLEASRAAGFLSKLGIRIGAVIVNKVLKLPQEDASRRLYEQKRALELLHKFFDRYPIVEVPYLDEEPRGLDRLVKLSRFLEEITEGCTLWSS